METDGDKNQSDFLPDCESDVSSSETQQMGTKRRRGRKRKTDANADSEPNCEGCKLRQASVKCNKCHTKHVLTFVDTPVEAGGTKCPSCNMYDNFNCIYTGKDGQIESFFTLFDVDQIRTYVVLSGKYPEDVRDILQDAKLSYLSIQNIFVKLGVNVMYKALSYSQIFTVDEIEAISKAEDQVVNRLQKYTGEGK